MKSILNNLLKQSKNLSAKIGYKASRILTMDIKVAGNEVISGIKNLKLMTETFRRESNLDQFTNSELLNDQNSVIDNFNDIFKNASDSFERIKTENIYLDEAVNNELEDMKNLFEIFEDINTQLVVGLEDTFKKDLKQLSIKYAIKNNRNIINTIIKSTASTESLIRDILKLIYETSENINKVLKSMEQRDIIFLNKFKDKNYWKKLRMELDNNNLDGNLTLQKISNKFQEELAQINSQNKELVEKLLNHLVELETHLTTLVEKSTDESLDNLYSNAYNLKNNYKQLINLFSQKIENSNQIIVNSMMFKKYNYNLLEIEVDNLKGISHLIYNFERIDETKLKQDLKLSSNEIKEINSKIAIFKNEQSSLIEFEKQIEKYEEQIGSKLLNENILMNIGKTITLNTLSGGGYSILRGLSKGKTFIKDVKMLMKNLESQLKENNLFEIVKDNMLIPLRAWIIKVFMGLYNFTKIKLNKFISIIDKGLISVFGDEYKELINTNMNVLNKTVQNWMKQNKETAKDFITIVLPVFASGFILTLTFARIVGEFNN